MQNAMTFLDTYAKCMTSGVCNCNYLEVGGRLTQRTSRVSVLRHKTAMTNWSPVCKTILSWQTAQFVDDSFTPVRWAFSTKQNSRAVLCPRVLCPIRTGLIGSGKPDTNETKIRMAWQPGLRCHPWEKGEINLSLSLKPSGMIFVGRLCFRIIIM